MPCLSEVALTVHDWAVTSAVGALLVITGCSTDRGGDLVHQFVGDTMIVEVRTPVHSAPARLLPVARYGALDDPGPASLGTIYAMTVDSEGAVLVYDDEGIKRFAPTGELVGLVARPGAGPGEVRHTIGLAVDPLGRLVALDLGNRRVMMADTDRSREIRLPDGLPRRHEDALHFGADGVLRLGFHPPFMPDGSDPRPRLAYLELGPDLVFSDSVMVPDRIWDRCPTASSPRYRVGFWEDEREPFIAKAVWALGPDGTMALGCPDRYEFDVVRRDGSVLRVRRPDAERVLLDRDHRRFMSEWWPMGPLPDERPFYARIILPGDGRIWVWPNQPAETYSPPPEVQARTGVTTAWRVSLSGWFDVYEADGSWLGMVPMPESAEYSGFPMGRPIFIRGDTLWAVTRDEWDVHYVTRFEVKWE
jgi:hypothetical protein